MENDSEFYFDKVCRVSLFGEMEKGDENRILYWDVQKDEHLLKYVGSRLEAIPEARKKNNEKISELSKELEAMETAREGVEDDEEKEQTENEMNYLVSQINNRRSFQPDVTAADLMAEAYRTERMDKVFFKYRYKGDFVYLSLKEMATHRGVQKSLEDMKVVV